MFLTEREKTLIVKALHLIEMQCYADEDANLASGGASLLAWWASLHHEIKDELGGTPDPKEIHKLVDKIKRIEPRRIPDPELEKLTIAARDGDDEAAKKLIERLAKSRG